ncbi:Actin- protein 6 [Tulasnella sp. 425]|nr:Actin- protein 6 [Tulasnella sp. 425]
MNGPSVLILDNGAHSIKAGFSKSSTDEARIIPNAIVRSKGDRRMYIGPEIDSCRDNFALHYRLPFEKGFLNDWDTEKAIWDRAFQDNVLAANPRDLSLLVTEPYFNLSKIQNTYDQIVFEEYEFQSYYRAPGAALIPFGTLFSPEYGVVIPECMVIVDTGFSFTHVVPILSGSIVWSAVRRIDVGGKLMTNHLKEIISYRHYNMMDQTYIVNTIKETCCYVSQSFASDLEECRSRPRRNIIVQEYVLPDFSTNNPGFVRQPAHLRKVPLTEEEARMPVLFVENERFSVPELLFNPSDIGLDQAGLPQTIAHCISLLPTDVQGLFWANIGLVGGNAKYPGIEERLLTELQPLAPPDCEVSVYKASEPVTSVYEAAWKLSQSPGYGDLVVSREEYLESGSNACRKKFHGSTAKPNELETPSTALSSRRSGDRAMAKTKEKALPA